MIDKKLKKFILKEANDRCSGTLVSTLGIKFTDVGETYLVAEMKVTPKLHQPAGVLPGGATAALAETVGSSAAAIFSKKDNQMLRGVELSINHVRGISEGIVIAKAEPTTPDPIINISKPIYELMSFSMSFIVFGTEEVRTSGSPSVTNTSSSILIPIFKYSFGTFLRSSLK